MEKTFKDLAGEREELSRIPDSNGIYPHNTMRFDVCMAYVYPMICDGLSIEQIQEKVANAIIQVVNAETEWRPEQVRHVDGVGTGNCRDGKLLSRSVILYAFD